MPKKILKPVINGIVASAILLGIYFAVLTFISGWNFAQNQFASYWYFIVSLVFGFGVQVGLYSFLRRMVEDGARAGGGTIAATGTTSGLAMVSCCTHYAVSILPILGVTGLAGLAAAYQIELFWVGIAFNLLGIAYLLRRVVLVTRIHHI